MNISTQTSAITAYFPPCDLPFSCFRWADSAGLAHLSVLPFLTLGFWFGVYFFTWVTPLSVSFWDYAPCNLKQSTANSWLWYSHRYFRDNYTGTENKVSEEHIKARLTFWSETKTPKQHICHCQRNNDLIAMVTNGSLRAFLVFSLLTVA